MVTSLMSNRHVQPVNFLQPNISQSRLGSYLPPEHETASDTVSISNTGSLLSRITQSAEKGSVSISSIEDDLANVTSFVEKNLQLLNKQIGINPSTKMEISVGNDGHILVNGKKPQSEELATAINENDELANAIRGMSMMSSAMEAIKRHQEMAAAYEKDPVDAINRYGYLLNDEAEYHVTFSMQNGHIDTKVQLI